MRRGTKAPGESYMGTMNLPTDLMKEVHKRLIDKGLTLKEAVKMLLIRFVEDPNIVDKKEVGNSGV
jgi:hypothetical protein